MSVINPPPIKIPDQLARDQETQAFFRSLLESFRLLWIRSGGASGGVIGIDSGGTAASSAATARTNLGLQIGQDVQAYDNDLADIAALLHQPNNVIVSNGTDWESKTILELANLIGFGPASSPTLQNLSVMGNLGVTGNASFATMEAGASTFYDDITLTQTTANYILVWNDPAAERDLTIIDPGGDDSFVFAAATQTLTNKTIDGDVNTLQDIGTGSLKTKTGIDADVVTGTAGTSGNLSSWNGDGDLVDAGLAITSTPVISSQAGAPGTTPSKIGDININTTAPAVYISTGTASSADWTIVS